MSTTQRPLPGTARSRAERLAALLPSLREQLEAQHAFRSEQLTKLDEERARLESAERQQVDAALADAARWALAEIDAALTRLTEGSYGTCDQCAGAIPLERLEVLPHTRYCPTCQQQQLLPET
ncbi:MAG: hypothetical protein GEV07_22735 [Streptosporangiales bacterium]|nr:hypothetical protein [Streptosporangiales bacterium]